MSWFVHYEGVFNVDQDVNSFRSRIIDDHIIHNVFIFVQKLNGICHLRMRSRLISYPTEHFSKLIYVREILFHRPYEAFEKSNTDIEELFSQPW